MIEGLAVVSVWADRAHPPDAVNRAVVEWLIAAEAEPWRAPSYPVGDPGPVQLRRVLVPVVEVQLACAIEHATGTLTVVKAD
jgi:hypothetical protein